MASPPAPTGPLRKIAASVLLAEGGLTLLLWPVYCLADGRTAAAGLGLALMNALPFAVLSGLGSALIMAVQRRASARRR